MEEIEKSFAEHLERCEKELEVSTNTDDFAHSCDVNIMGIGISLFMLCKSRKERRRTRKGVKKSDQKWIIVYC